MYNDKRYSLARYSVNPETRTIETSARFFETMEAVVGAAVPVESRCRFKETLHGSVRGTLSMISVFSAFSSLFMSAQGSVDVITRVCFSDALQDFAYAQKNIPTAMEAMEELDARIVASKDIPSELLVYADHLAALAAGSKNIQISFTVSEILTSLSAAISQTTERTTLQLTIPPGGELRIDSDLFTVLLDGENALHTQSGDWINISRELLRLIVESASGGQLQGQIIYTERYL